MAGERREYLLLWFIENYSYAPLKRGRLDSPEIPAEGLRGTSWLFSLHPEKLRIEDCRYGSLYLKRSGEDDGPQNFSIQFEISITTVDGCCLYSEECEHTFRKGAQRGFKAFVDMDELFVRKSNDFLPLDTLVVRCRMWKGEDSVRNVSRCSARTRIGFDKIVFIHKVHNFSALQSPEEKTDRYSFHSKPGCFFSSKLYISKYYTSGGSIIIDISSSDSAKTLCRVKLSLLGVSGSTIECGVVDYRFDVANEMESNMQRFLTRQFILSKGTEYLPNDELSLLCECTFVTGMQFEKIEEILHEIPMETFSNEYSEKAKNSLIPSKSEDTILNDNNQILTNEDLKLNAFSTANTLPSTNSSVVVNDPKQCQNNDEKTLSAHPGILDDIKVLYNNHFLTDIELKTAAKSFPAHKVVLCIRSGVFRDMLTNEIEEKDNKCIQVEDLDDDTVGQLLLFMYSDNLENLQWKSAIQLYDAGDKYGVEALREFCSNFLVSNLSTSNAIELLLLASGHRDSELEKLTEAFIFKHKKTIFSSEEWRKLSETNPQLVVKTMLSIYKREE